VKVQEPKPIGLHLRDAFVVLNGRTILHSQPESRIENCHIVNGGIVPRSWRRRRLRWTHPVLRRLWLVRALWRWLA
jgi:hypothetical protein